jgi:hypothetical protein
MTGQDMMQDGTRKAAKSVVTPVIAQKFPGRNTEAITDCVIDNATTRELLGLAKDAVTGGTGSVATVITITGRPGTLKCIVKSELRLGTT